MCTCSAFLFTKTSYKYLPCPGPGLGLLLCKAVGGTVFVGGGGGTPLVVLKCTGVWLCLGGRPEDVYDLETLVGVTNAEETLLGGLNNVGWVWRGVVGMDDCGNDWLPTGGGGGGGYDWLPGGRNGCASGCCCWTGGGNDAGVNGLAAGIGGCWGTGCVTLKPEVCIRGDLP